MRTVHTYYMYPSTYPVSHPRATCGVEQIGPAFTTVCYLLVPGKLVVTPSPPDMAEYTREEVTLRDKEYR